MSLAVLLTSVLWDSPIAFAVNNCANNVYYYGGETLIGNPVYEGSEGVVTGGSHVLEKAYHDIDYLALENEELTYNLCNRDDSGGYCWISAGNGIGNVGGHVSNGFQGYMEENDVNGYAVNWTNGTCASGQEYVSLYFTGVYSRGYPEFVAIFTSDGTCGYQHVGTAYTYTVGQDFVAASEVDGSGGECAQFNHTYFGANTSAQTSTGTELQLSLNGATWNPINGATLDNFYQPQVWAGWLVNDISVQTTGT